jgi:PAS domain S-box-containing protein
MIELAKVTLNNEMDLIIAHKKSMKLAELSGLSLSAQTTFATAVSEVSRSAIENGKNSCLILSVSNSARNEKYIVAAIKDSQAKIKNEGFEYAKKLVNRFHISSTDKESTIELHYFIPGSVRLNTRQIEEWKEHFKEEPPVSPYEEIKRKNEQLQSLAAKLQESEEQYKTLTNSLPLIIFSIDNRSTITYANEWLIQFTGYSIEELNVNKWKEVIHPDDYDSFAVLLNEKVASNASTLKLQCRLKHQATEEYFWHLISVSPLHDEKGNILHRIGFMADIHAQKEYQQTLEDNKELRETQHRLKLNEENLQHHILELNRSNNELQQFAYIASHDLQEPVRKIIFYGDYLGNKLQGQLDKRSEGYLNNMMTASHRMRNLINDLLSFSQVNQAPNFRKINLNVVMQEALQDLELTIKEKSATIDISPLPEIKGDPILLRQLFENIISNSLKYSKEGVPVQIQIANELQDDKLIISFNDNGIGFDEKYIEKIFSLFQRLHSRENYAGTGLGLAICRKIVEVHGGSIVANSNPGEGATFFVTLPVKGRK